VQLAFAAAPLGSHGFFHHLHRLGHLFEIAGIEAHVFFQLLLLEADQLTHFPGPQAQRLGILVIAAGQFLQNGNQTHRMVARVVEIAAAGLLEHAAQQVGGTVAFLLQPLANLSLPMGGQAGAQLLGLLAQIFSGEIGGGTKGAEELFAAVGGFKAGAETVKHLGEPQGKQGIGAKTLLARQQMQFHQQLIHHPPVKARDNAGIGVVEAALAVRHRLANAHRMVLCQGRP